MPEHRRDRLRTKWSTSSRAQGRNACLLQNPSPDATAAFFRSEVSRMARRVKQSGLKLD